MARKSKGKTTPTATSTRSPTQPLWLNVSRAVILLLLASASSQISQRTLAPVYGGTPSSKYHGALSVAALFTGALLRSRFPELLGRRDAAILPALAFWVPTIQYFLFQHSSELGNPLGPAVTELLTIFPLVLLSMSVASGLLEELTSRLERYGQFVSEQGVLVGGWLLFRAMDGVLQSTLPRYIGINAIFTVGGLQLGIAALYTVTLPSLWVLLAIPSLLFSLTWNVHMPFAGTTARLNATLQEIGFQLVDRQESLTGYISVLDSSKFGFRAMRCDHSLLGGDWTRKFPGYNPRVADPIFAVFTMLESVRLALPDNGKARREDAGSNALVIGLGVGSTPAALIHHGINTTIVEIDPVVHRFASQYFHLPSNHTAVIGDALTFVEEEQRRQPEEISQYDYIIHDVFTGGVEPVELFTAEFLQGLSALLKDDGVIAINYAGDISLPGTRLVVRTVLSVFPQCRIFRENDSGDNDKDDGKSSSSSPADFTNMVIMCKKTTTPPLRFREPTPADFLGSRAREMYMVLRHEVDPAVFVDNNDDNDEILRAGKTNVLTASHANSAVGHWRIMRNVLPAEVWENW